MTLREPCPPWAAPRSLAVLHIEPPRARSRHRNRLAPRHGAARCVHAHDWALLVCSGQGPDVRWNGRFLVHIPSPPPPAAPGSALRAQPAPKPGISCTPLRLTSGRASGGTRAHAKGGASQKGSGARSASSRRGLGLAHHPSREAIRTSSRWSREVGAPVGSILVPGKCTPGLAHGMPGSFWTFLGPHAGVCGNSACGNRSLKKFRQEKPNAGNGKCSNTPFSITVTKLNVNFQYDT